MRSRRRATTPPQGGDIAFLVHALETGHDHDPSGREVAAHALVIDLANTRLVVGTVGADMDLGTGIGARGTATLFQRHAEQRDGDLFAGGQQYVEFPGHRVVGDLGRQVQQAIGFAAHGGHHDHDVIAALAPVADLVGHVPDAFRRADRGAAVFLNYQSHIRLYITKPGPGRPLIMELTRQT